MQNPTETISTLTRTMVNLQTILSTISISPEQTQILEEAQEICSQLHTKYVNSLIDYQPEENIINTNSPLDLYLYHCG
jgi:hypothetical protein